jgi:hypothetical protein
MTDARHDSGSRIPPADDRVRRAHRLSDDPSGGRRLSRRLAIALPVSFVVGLAIGVPLAIVAGAWPLAPLIAVGLAALVGGVLAAVEDGRVQRRVERISRGGPSGEGRER